MAVMADAQRYVLVHCSSLPKLLQSCEQDMWWFMLHQQRDEAPSRLRERQDEHGAAGRHHTIGMPAPACLSGAQHTIRS